MSLVSSSPLQTGFEFSWQPPQGTLASFFSFLLSCQPLLPGLPTPAVVATAVGELSGGVVDMEDGSAYSCSLRATVESYSSEPATITVTTPETGELFCLVPTQRFFQKLIGRDFSNC